ncbi:hypothetical protein BASA81_000230 [Batrachochytrium salamandrivorans]|nr:hypothetical protein BASA81_000230 [Batrachochytrium salamandrivorans]
MRRLVLGFPGQGSQKHGMGRALALKYPTSAGRVFDEANSTLGGLFTNLVWTTQEQAEMHQTQNSQPIVLATSIALLAALRERHGFEISLENSKYVLGHSLGEYSALVAAGSVSLKDALLLVRRRGELMQEACRVWGKTPSMCAVVNLTWDQALEIQNAAPVGLVCEAANDNGKEQVVLSGCEEGIAWGISRAKQVHGARRAIKIKGVSCPFHSSVMKSAAELFAPELAKVKFARPVVPIILGETALPTTEVKDISAGLVRGIYSPVRWSSCLQRAKLEDVVEFKEIGGSTLRFGLDEWKHVGSPVRPDQVEDIESFTNPC